jgi:hypothetical protein
VARFEASIVSTTYGGEPSVDAALYSGAAGSVAVAIAPSFAGAARTAEVHLTLTTSDQGDHVPLSSAPAGRRRWS